MAPAEPPASTPPEAVTPDEVPLRRVYPDMPEDAAAPAATMPAEPLPSTAPRPEPDKSAGFRRLCMEQAYDEFAKADSALSAKRTDIAIREAALLDRRVALERRKAELLAQIERKKRAAATASSSERTERDA